MGNAGLFGTCTWEASVTAGTAHPTINLIQLPTAAQQVFDQTSFGQKKKNHCCAALMGHVECWGMLTNGVVVMVVLQEMGGRGTVDAVLNMVTVDWKSYLSLLTVVGVLAPVLEEVRICWRNFFWFTLPCCWSGACNKSTPLWSRGDEPICLIVICL